MKRAPLVLLGLASACARVLGFQAGELDATERDAAGAAGFSEPNLAGAPAQGGSGSLDPAAGAPGEFGGASQRCGNQELDAAEECDGDKRGGATCTTAGERAGGVVSCDQECHYDFGACYSIKAVAVSDHVCAVFDNGKLKCWGQNYSGQLGLGDEDLRGEEGDAEMGAGLPFVPLEAPVKQVTVGLHHTCVLLADNTVHCWGDNSYGQLGVPDVERLISAAEAPALDLGTGTIERIEAGGRHTCARFASGRIKCWGENSYGQLGVGDGVSRGKQDGDLRELPFVDLGFGAEGVELLGAGSIHTCASGFMGMKCWGAILYTNFVSENLAVGDEPSEMGANLPLFDLGWGAVSEMVSGDWHNCARNAEQGSVKCWGDNTFGQLGSGDSEPRIDPGRLGAELDEVDLGGSVLALSAGARHTCALLQDNRLKCWGGNDSGQLGLGDSDGRGAYPDQMGEMLPAVDLGRGHTIVGVAAGATHSCAILDRGRLKCWGQNNFGTLGLGHKLTMGLQAGEMGDALPFIEL